MSDVNRDGDRSDDGVPDLRLRQTQIVAHNRHQRGDAKPSHEAKKKHPKWDRHSPSDVRTVAVEAWLGTLVLAPGTRAELRNLMHAPYNHAMRWEFFDRNPITLVRQSAKNASP